jgi:AsmA protein
VSSLGRELTISAESALVGSRVLLRELTADSGVTSIRASGTVALEPRVEADLRIAANRLDVDELLALAAAFLPSSSNAAAAAGPPPRLKALVNAATARAAGVDARQFAATMEVEGDRVSLSPLTFELFGGRYDGGIQARLGSRINATMRAKLDGVDVAQVAAFGNSPDTVSGRLSGSAAVSGEGRDLAEALASARGNGTVLIADGTMQRLGLVRSIVLFFGRPEANAPASTDRFDRLDAQFALAGGRLRAERFSLRSPDVDGSGSGTLHLTAHRLEGRMNVTLSEALSRQAGTDFRRYTREGDRIVLPVVVAGTLSEPRVTIDAAAALQRGLRNEAERRLKGILDRFR